jgi:hypothetical protein
MKYLIIENKNQVFYLGGIPATSISISPLGSQNSQQVNGSIYFCLTIFYFHRFRSRHY